ncbi:MAG: segregation/condensation protein A [Phycisphaeraceae bacterium]|nr:MAG: segregation/condensation protein A [Phycisphaeraceae bacterium]
MLTEDYRVRLDAFEGPLDLLLYLIRKNEVDPHDIPVGVIAAQYIEFLAQVDAVDIEAAGEFLVMAATLTEIKARMLTPAPTAPVDEADAPAKDTQDPRAELVRQLLAYKQYRDAATSLERRADEWTARFPASPKKPEHAPEADDASPADIDADELGLVDLAEAFRRVMETINIDRLGDHTVVYDDTPIELHAADIVDFIARAGRTDGEGMDGTGGGGGGGGGGRVEFNAIFKGRTRAQAVGLFLALLTLVRDRRVVVRQDLHDGTIVLEAGAGVEPAASPEPGMEAV